MDNNQKKDWKNHPWTTYRNHYDWKIQVVAFFIMLIVIIFFS